MLNLVEVVDALKAKAINEYEWLLEHLFKGHKEDYKHLLNLIEYIELPLRPNNDPELLEYFLSQVWHTPCHSMLPNDKKSVEYTLPVR